MRKPTIRAILTAVLAVICLSAWTTALEAAGDPKKGKEKVLENMRCSACHGDKGHGDGPAAAALNPKPRNFTDCSYMEKRSDDDLFTVIKEGAQALDPKLSPLMVAFKTQLTDPEIKDIVAYIRSLPEPPCKVKEKKEKKKK